jgi:hypothetical protein
VSNSRRASAGKYLQRSPNRDCIEFAAPCASECKWTFRVSFLLRDLPGSDAHPHDSEWCPIDGGCLLNAHRSSLLVTVVTLISMLGVFQPLAFANPQAQDTKDAQVEVRLIPKKKSIKVGDVLQVRVEIWNVGTKSFFIEKEIYNLCVAAPLSLRLDLGPPMKPQTGPGRGCAGDCVYTAKDSFARRLVGRWTVLSPGDFYGTDISVYPDSFPQLYTPGRWRLGGTYKSIGNLSSSPCWDTAPIPDNAEQIKGLGLEAWQGEVDTNTVWINVVRTGSSTPFKKSP